MADMLTELSQTGWSPTRINDAFQQLAAQLEQTPTSVEGLAAGDATGWDSGRSSSVLSSLFPPGPALALHDGLARLAAGGMVPPSPTPSLAARRKTVKSLAPATIMPPAGDGLFPWAVLADPASVGIMADALPTLLGLTGQQYSTSDELLLHLGTTRGAPVTGLDQTAGIALLQRLSDSPQQVRPQDPGTDPDVNPPANPSLSDAAKALINAILDGFRTAHFEAYWWGYKMKFGPDFCAAFPGLLLGAEASLGLKALAALISTAGFWAAISAAAAAVGGWVVAAVLVYGLYMAAMVKLNATSAGVWMGGIWLTGVPLWCQGA